MLVTLEHILLTSEWNCTVLSGTVQLLQTTHMLVTLEHILLTSEWNYTVPSGTVQF